MATSPGGLSVRQEFRLRFHSLDRFGETQPHQRSLGAVLVVPLNFGPRPGPRKHLDSCSPGYSSFHKGFFPLTFLSSQYINQEKQRASPPRVPFSTSFRPCAGGISKGNRGVWRGGNSGAYPVPEVRLCDLDATIDLLVRFLAQGQGRLSTRARTREFNQLTEPETGRVEQSHKECFLERAKSARSQPSEE